MNQEIQQTSQITAEIFDLYLDDEDLTPRTLKDLSKTNSSKNFLTKVLTYVKV